MSRLRNGAAVGKRKLLISSLSLTCLELEGMGVEAGWSLHDTPRLTVWHLEGLLVVLVFRKFTLLQVIPLYSNLFNYRPFTNHVGDVFDVSFYCFCISNKDKLNLISYGILPFLYSSIQNNFLSWGCIDWLSGIGQLCFGRPCFAQCHFRADSWRFSKWPLEFALWFLLIPEKENSAKYDAFSIRNCS